MNDRALIFEISKPGRMAYSFADCDVPEKNIEQLIPREYMRENAPELPEVSEVEAVRHFVGLSRLNHAVDTGFYPLGSCTMKYNPKVNEDVAALNGFSSVHPLQPENTVQGCLELVYRTGEMLAEITGMEKVSLQPAAGAHGELTGLMIMKAWHIHNGQEQRRKIIIPDSAHGTNPASAAFAGFEVIQVKSNERGGVDLDSLKSIMGADIAGLMLTNPNTLGLFDENIKQIAHIVHEAGGLLYYDGANANAILGITRPGDMGFDIVHLNLHKTFSTPHGGGGPGSGPVGVTARLVPFLPSPIVEFRDGKYRFDYNCPLSIGKVKSFYGNFAVVVKTYAYILSMGPEGLKMASETAVLNANYVMNKLKEYYELPYERSCMHEFVISAQKQKNLGVSALDVAKRLMDYGIHPPTIYFPLIVKEALMVEPTETESRETLDEFAEVMIKIAEEAEHDPETVKNAPYSTPVGRLDEVRAAREPVLRWDKEK
ncbi:MAG TPA: aminomethyl-transferring glycine dehydrogenase subunit GcvPB [Clostridiales bacterium]|nr:aminomethyl-transferring glycine dehydrogenase subunit GcvPB [Clostridiales bacterium]